MRNLAKKKIVIAGGGYGGLKAVQTLVDSNVDLEIILIDQHPYHYLQPDVYDYIANKKTVTDVTISLVTLVASYNGKVEFVRAEITGFDFEQNTVITSTGNISYDYLIIALGARTFFPDYVEGLHQYAHGIKSVRWAFRFKQQFEQAINKKIEEEGICDIHPDFNIVIGGGGLSGVEIAGEMADYVSKYFRSSGYNCGGINIYLIEGSKHILAGQDQYLVNTSRDRLESLGIKIWEGTYIKKVEENAVHLADGTKIDMNFMIWTGGIKASHVLATIDQEKNPRNQVFVDSKLRVGTLENVFAVGDCAVIKDENDKIMPPTAQTAERAGVACAKNILAIVQNDDMQDIKLKFDGVMVALGGCYAAAYLMNKFKFKGPFAYFVKHIISVLYKWPLVSKCKAGIKNLSK